MTEKIKSAAIRALWTMLQTAFGFVVANASTLANLNPSKILIASLTAGVVSFAKSMGIGMPETDPIITDGELEVIFEPINNEANGAMGGVKWNPDFNLAERIASADNPVIILGVKKTMQQSEDTYRRLRI